MTPMKKLIKNSSSNTNNNLVRTMARCTLAFVSAVLVLMQMSSSLGIYGKTFGLHDIDDAAGAIEGAITTPIGVDQRRATVKVLENGRTKIELLRDNGQHQSVKEEKEEEVDQEDDNKDESEEKKEEGTSVENEIAEETEPAATVGGTKIVVIDSDTGKDYDDSDGDNADTSTTSTIAESSSSTSTASTATTNQQTLLEPPHPIDSTLIRKWGCARNEAPFIFVHIGKAGGGGVRARIAASALDFNRTKWHRPGDDESYYYPIIDEQTGNVHKGKLIHSEAGNFLPHFVGQEEQFPFQRTFRFEGSYPCHATTPLGHAMACHMEKNICHSRDEDDNKDGNRCDLVYMGHNVLGGEMNFLPTQYLLNWWTNTSWAQEIDTKMNAIETQVATKLQNRYSRDHRIFDPKRLNPARRKCANGSFTRRFQYNQMYEKCIYPETEIADMAARAATTKTTTAATTNSDNNLMTIQNDNWGPLYASLPVLRVTMLREPFSWLKSKFFWMSDHMNTKGEPSKLLAFRGEGRAPRIMRSWDDKKRKLYENAEWVKCDDINNFAQGWGKQGALEYIFYLCGEHCMGQWQAIQERYSDDPEVLKQKHLDYLQVMEDTAAYNLRNSFAVVGLLQETPEFFDMITQRVQYMDTSLNPHIRGDSHSSGKGPEMNRCSEVFKSEAFQKEVMDHGPEIATLVRLYEIGLQVNQFQRQELEQCPASSS